MPGKALTSKRYQVSDIYEAMELYHKKGWTDGLPIVPPTEEMVQAFLEAGGREPSEVLGIEPVRGRVITAEKAAVNTVMAGCKPEYFPVVAAAIEAMCQEPFNFHAITVSTAGAAVMAVVNGPIAKELGMNSGISLFGPGNRPNATIGRAIRLIITNVTEAAPGELDKATFGHPGKFSYCFAEAEEISPWEPMHVERGFPKESSTVTVFAAMAPLQVSSHAANTPEPVLTGIADALKAYGPSQGEVVLVLAPEHLGHIKAAGWSKSQVKEFLAQKARRTIKDWQDWGRMESGTSRDDLNKLLSVCKTSNTVTVIVGGGAAGAFSVIISLWGGGTSSRSEIREIKRPGKK